MNFGGIPMFFTQAVALGLLQSKHLSLAFLRFRHIVMDRHSGSQMLRDRLIFLTVSVSLQVPDNFFTVPH